MKKSNLFEFEDKYFFGSEEEVVKEIATVYGYDSKDVVPINVDKLDKPVLMYKGIVVRNDNKVTQLTFRCSKVTLSQAVSVLEKSVKQVLAIL